LLVGCDGCRWVVGDQREVVTVAGVMSCRVVVVSCRVVVPVGGG
jgi:hypothetical protein